MRALSAADLMHAWERAVGQPPVERALTLLSAGCPEPAESLAALPIGQRDARLSQVYEQLFGPTLEAFAECPRCAERLEYGLATRDLCADPATAAAPELTLVSGDLSLRLRLPNSLDLRAAGRCGDLDAARRLLLERCVVEATSGGCAVPAQALPPEAVEQIEALLAQADPQAESQIDLTCPACGHGWTVALDIAAFLWTRWNGLARRLLREVHVLARAYGWREADILALSWIRRQAYLELAGA